MERLSIIIPAHDSYGDVVEVFEKCFKAQWPDCPYDVYWANGSGSISSDVIKVINCGEQAAFCKRILCALDQIETKYVLIWVEDFLPTGRINTSDIENLLDYMDSHDSRHCSLLRVRKKRMKRADNSSRIYIQDPDRPYSVSFAIEIYRPDYIRELIKDENWFGWDLENYGLYLASKKLNTGHLYYDIDFGKCIHLIARGKIFPAAAHSLQSLGVDLTGIKREYLTDREVKLSSIKIMVATYIPTPMRRAIKKVGGKLGIKFVTEY